MAKSAEVSFTKSVNVLNQRMEEKDEYIKDLEEKRNEVYITLISNKLKKLPISLFKLPISLFI
jgi:hypothetical protein